MRSEQQRREEFFLNKEDNVNSSDDEGGEGNDPFNRPENESSILEGDDICNFLSSFNPVSGAEDEFDESDMELLQDADSATIEDGDYLM